LDNTISEEKVQARLEVAKKDIKHSDIEGFYEKIIINDDLTKTLDELEQYLFGKGTAASAERFEATDGTPVKTEAIIA
jgi:guanylate kinase